MQSQDRLSIWDPIPADRKICTAGPNIQEPAYQMLGVRFHAWEFSAVNLPLHLCEGPLDHFRSCLFLLLVIFLVKLKLFTLLGCLRSWWIPPLLMVSHADPLMGALKYNLLGYFLSLTHAQFYNHSHVDIVNPITQSTVLLWTVNCQILSWVPDDLLPHKCRAANE